MDETLKLQLEAVDKFAALEKMLDKLTSIDKTLSIINKSLEKIEEVNPFIKLLSQITVASVAMKVFKGIVQGVVYLLKTGFEVGKGLLDKVISGQVFKQSTLIAFKTFFKSQEEAQKQYQHLFDVGELTPGTAEGLKGATLKFAAAGFSLPEIDTLQGLYADAQALGGLENGENFASAISKIRNQGRLTGETLRFESIEKVGVGDILLDLGKKLKITGNPEDIKKKVNKLVSKGAIDSNLAISAIRDVQNSKLGNNLAGEYAIKQGRESLEGALSNVQEGFDNLFRKLDLKNIPILQQFLTNFADALKDPDVKRKLEETINLLLGKLQDFTKEDFIKALNLAASALQIVGNAISSVYDYIKKIKNEGFGVIFEDAVVGLKDLFIYIGAIIGKGIRASIFGNEGGIIQQFDEKHQKSLPPPPPPPLNPPGKSDAVTLPSGEVIELTQNSPFGPSPFSPPPGEAKTRPDGSIIVTVNVDASNSGSPQAVGEAVSKAAGKVLADHHRNTRRDKQQKGL